MTSLAIILVIGSAILHVARDFLTKSSKDRQIFIWWTIVISLMFTLPVIIYLLVKDGLPNLTGVSIAAGMSLIHFLYWYLYSKAYDHGDLSQVYPIIRSAPAFVLIFAVIFLNEKVSFLGVLGILLVTFGVYFINLNGFRVKTLLQFFSFDFRQKYVKFAFLALIMTIFIVLIDKVGVSYINPIIYGFIVALIGSIFFGLYIFHVKSRSEIVTVLRENKRKLTLSAFFAATNYPLLLFAFSMSKASYVTGLKQVGTIFAVVAGGHFLREKNRTIRLTAAIFIAVGAVLIAVAK